jgi:concentrative nucleoside transporter, CNT family
MAWLQSFLGFIGLAVLAWLFSEKHGRVNWQAVIVGLLLQLALALLLIKLPGSQSVFLWLNHLVESLAAATQAGTGMVFGYLGGAPLPFVETHPGASYILAFQGLPLILVVSALSALLFYWKILPVVVKAFAWVLQRTMGIGGVEGFGTTVNIFVGMVEAPLFIRPYLLNISRSELFTIMVSGMAGIAGTVMVLYASILKNVIPGVMGHLLVASILSAPAAIVTSKLMVPEFGVPSSGRLDLKPDAHGAMDAVTRGTFEGVQLLINILAMLVVLIALVHLVNLGLGVLPRFAGEPLTLQRCFGWLFAPVAWLMGIPWRESLSAGSLLGTKTVLNEFLAYLDLAKLPAGTFSGRSTLIMTYGLCGFANLGSLGIMIGGMGAMVPERRAEIVQLGLKSILAGALATCMTGAVIGMIY